MKYIVSLNGKNYEVEVEKGEATILKTTEAPTINKTTVEESKTVTTKVEEQKGVASKDIDGEPIKAPMPGTVLDVKVKPGDKVKSGDIVMILEAMKMENEIVAPKDGVVAQVIAAKDSSVSTGDILIVLQ